MHNLNTNQERGKLRIYDGNSILITYLESSLCKEFKYDIHFVISNEKVNSRDEKILGGLTNGKNGPHEKFWEVPVARIVRSPENELFLTSFITDPIQRPHR